MLSAPTEATSVAFAVHAEALALCSRLRKAEHAPAVLLARVHADQLHHELGFASALDYAVHALDLSHVKAEGLLRLGRSLPRLPVLDQAWAAGEVAWSKARDMLKVLTPENEAAWVERARTVTSRQLERDVDLSLVGDAPPSHVGEPKAPARKRLTFHLTTVDAEMVQAVLKWARASLGTDSDDVGDGEILAALLQRVMHDVPNEAAPTAERFRKVVQHCPECAGTTGLHADLTDTTVLEAHCDAEILEMRDGPRRGHLSHTVPPATRRAVLHRDAYACRVPGCSNCLWVDVHHIRYQSDGGTHDEENLVTVCSVHHTLIHDGRLSVERAGDRLVFTFRDGRVVEVPLAPPKH